MNQKWRKLWESVISSIRGADVGSWVLARWASKLLLPNSGEAIFRQAELTGSKRSWLAQKRPTGCCGPHLTHPLTEAFSYGTPDHFTHSIPSPASAFHWGSIFCSPISSDLWLPVLIPSLPVIQRSSASVSAPELPMSWFPMCGLCTCVCATLYQVNISCEPLLFILCLHTCHSERYSSVILLQNFCLRLE